MGEVSFSSMCFEKNRFALSMALGSDVMLIGSSKYENASIGFIRFFLGVHAPFFLFCWKGEGCDISHWPTSVSPFDKDAAIVAVWFVLITGTTDVGTDVIPVIEANKKIAASKEPVNNLAPVKKKLPTLPLQKLNRLWALFKISKSNRVRKPRIASFFSIEMSLHRLLYI